MVRVTTFLSLVEVMNKINMESYPVSN